MWTNEIKKLACQWKVEGKSYVEIARLLKISKSSAQSLCNYKMKIHKQKRGRHFAIDKKTSLRIKRTTSSLLENGTKVNCKKIILNTDLNVSRWTVGRYLRRHEYRYKKANVQINLTKKHKQDRLNIVKSWIISDHDWFQTVFSDEKKFSFDGPDNWSSYLPKNQNMIRQRRICGGGSVMVWMMIFPNGLLSFRFIDKTFNSQKYIKILKESVVPLLKLNLGKKAYFQHDNSPIHTSQIIRKFIVDSKLDVVLWPARSPDLNIIEDVWKYLSDIVYDGFQYKNQAELKDSITNAIERINIFERQKVINLYSTMRSRLCTVIEKKGGLCNKL